MIINPITAGTNTITFLLRSSAQNAVESAADSDVAQEAADAAGGDADNTQDAVGAAADSDMAQEAADAAGGVADTAKEAAEGADVVGLVEDALGGLDI